MKDWKLIAEKQAEYIEHLKSPTPTIESYAAWRKKNNVFDSELSLLESQEVEGGSAEEIIKGHISCTCDVMYKTRKMTDPNCVLCEYGGEIELMMEEYAQQSSNVTDEDIEKWADKNSGSKYSRNHFPVHYQNLWLGLVKGAKAMRDNLIKPE